MTNTSLCNTISEIGALLLKHGAEIYRVEESLERMLSAYGFQQVEVFAIPTYFSVSVMLEDQTVYHLTKRTRQNKINLDMLYELNTLVRTISQSLMPKEEIVLEIQRISNIPLRNSLIFIGYGLSAGFSAVFFGGGISECLVGTLIGFVVYLIIQSMEHLRVNQIVSTLLASIALSTLTIACHKLHIVQNFQAITTGCLMILVPGVAITNSLRDLIGGEFVSGISRMVEAIVIAASIAIGVGIMMIILGG